MVGRELDAPYHRPPVSKGYLRGQATREEALVRRGDWWERNGIELLSRTSVLELDPAARVAKLSTKEEVRFATALLATGAMVRRLGVEGAHLEGIHYLRTLGNADTVRRDVAEVERVVMIGGSYIGCEVAASLTELGKRCTIVMQEPVTLARGFGARAGRFFQTVLEDHGVEVMGDDEVECFEGNERVSRVVTKGGRTIAAEAVVAGVGAQPDVMLARRAGLRLGAGGGVATDACLQSSAPGLYAAGDMCEYHSVLHDRPLRIEHEDVAEEQGRTAARGMLGRAEPHAVVPYFFAELSDWAGLEYVGPALSWDEEIVRGSLEDGRFSVWYVEGDRVRGVLSVGRPDDLEHGRRLIASGSSVAGALGTIADEAQALDGLAPAGR